MTSTHYTYNDYNDRDPDETGVAERTKSFAELGLPHAARRLGRTDLEGGPGTGRGRARREPAADGGLEMKTVFVASSFLVLPSCFLTIFLPT